MCKWETFKNLSLHEKSESRNFHWKTFFVSNLLKFYDFVNNLMIRSKSKGQIFIILSLWHLILILKPPQRGVGFPKKLLFRQLKFKIMVLVHRTKYFYFHFLHPCFRTSGRVRFFSMMRPDYVTYDVCFNPT